MKKDLDSAQEILLSVVGRKSGKNIPRPVWFVRDGDKLFLLPVYGKKTEWYQNVIQNPNTEISLGGDTYQLRIRLISNPEEVKRIVEKFREKYGAANLKQYYTDFDAATEVSLA